jgi:potassium-transporting ATPase KdpC subunit
MRDAITSTRLFVLSILGCSVVYPAVILGFAALVAPEARQGSLVKGSDGTVIGSRLLAQKFTRPEYFWPRPSACEYNASAAGGSNLSPTNPLLTDKARQIIGQLRLDKGQLVPADLVSASGSGMDPHISLAAAMFQVARVADAWNLPPEQVKELVRQHIDSPTLVVLGGEPIVNVLELNLALDQVVKRPATAAP